MDSSVVPNKKYCCITAINTASLADMFDTYQMGEFAINADEMPGKYL